MTQYVLAASNALHIDAVLDFFRNMRKAYVRRQNIRQTMKELHALSNRELNDIGIARGDIWAIAHEDADYKRFAETNNNLKGWV